MNKTLPLIALVAALAAPLFSHAATLEGACFMSVDKDGNKSIPLDGKVVDGNTLKCNKGTWTTPGTGGATGDANSYVALYAWEGKSPDARVELKFRPRKSECLVNVRTSATNTVHTFANGHNCDTDYKSAMSMNATQTSNVTNPVTGETVINPLTNTPKTTKSFAAQLTTSTKAHNFTATYMNGQDLLGISGDTNLYLIGVFIEDK